MMGSMKKILMSSSPNSNSNVELEESEIWNNNGYSSSNDDVRQFERMMRRVSCNPTKSISIPTTTKIATSSTKIVKKLPSGSSSSWNKSKTASSVSMSLPMNVPDWSKIMGQGQLDQQLQGHNNTKNNHNRYYDVTTADDDEDGDVGDEDWVPPHEYTARQMTRRSGMAVAFSVHEGVGRTLKGRDLSRVRNAIWKQTGFED